MTGDPSSDYPPAANEDGGRVRAQRWPRNDHLGHRCALTLPPTPGPLAKSFLNELLNRTVSKAKLPLLPLILAAVPAALKRALAQEGIPFQLETSGPPAGRFVLYDSARETRCAASSAQVMIDVRRLATEEREDPFEALDDEQSKRHSWRIGGLDVSEEVARVDKHALRRRILARLRATLEAEGGVWLRVGAFPFPYRSAFNYRIDYDDYDPADFHAMLDAMRGREGSFSHYVCGASYESQPDALDRLRGRDVGSHGYWRHTYLDATENLRNVRRGIDVLRAAGIEPIGFAAPHGRYNRGLNSALAVLGVTHSSEFGLAYDDVPFFPSGSDVLQIPFHPIGLGIFLDAASQTRTQGIPTELAAADIASAHFQRIVHAKYQAGEPIFLYGHPTRRLGRYPHVVGDVFRVVSDFAALWHTTLAEFARWWRARAEVSLRVVREDRQIVCHVLRQPAGYRCAIEFFRGEHVAPMPLDDAVIRFTPEALAYQARRPQAMLRPVRVDRPEGLRGSVLRYFDWERVTPVDEINAGWWRGWVKRTLRRIQK